MQELPGLFLHLELLVLRDAWNKQVPKTPTLANRANLTTLVPRTRVPVLSLPLKQLKQPLFPELPPLSLHLKSYGFRELNGLSLQLEQLRYLNYSCSLSYYNYSCMYLELL